MHAGGKTEWIGVEHRVVRVKTQLVHPWTGSSSVGVLSCFVVLHRWLRLHRRLLGVRKHLGELLLLVLARFWTVRDGLVARIVLIDCRCGVVLLFCTHGINIGRTKLY